jgi:hypothetical protein
MVIFGDFWWFWRVWPDSTSLEATWLHPFI